MLGRVVPDGRRFRRGSHDPPECHASAERPARNWLLNDHEDNLYYKGLGIANEPVYIQQATAYLLGMTRRRRFAPSTAT